ncbi:MAG: dehydrogenase [Pirellulaceae bacterium]|nr:MAG: dehydrogenase [Pirellulaceae bacterium]
MIRVSCDVLAAFSAAILEAAGALPDEAQCVARSLVDADLCGYASHGVMRVPFYCEAIAKNETIPGATFSVLRESEVVLAADGNWGFGQVQCRRLVERVLTKADRFGLAAGTLIHASHIGRLGEYCEMAAARGMLSMLMVNTHGAARRVAPPGGKSPRLGTNPMALGAPTDQDPLILDFSTSATAEGKVRTLSLAGKPCPPGWLLDSEGRPTTDPNVLYRDPPGSILPMGGDQPYKGFGLALMIDIFAGALSGGLCAREVPQTPKGNCVFFAAMKPEAFGGRQHYQQEVAQLCAFVRSCPRVEGAGEILLPGDPERRQRQERLENGIPIEDAVWNRLTELARQLAVPVPAVEIRRQERD